MAVIAAPEILSILAGVSLVFLFVLYARQLGQIASLPSDDAESAAHKRTLLFWWVVGLLFSAWPVFALVWARREAAARRV